MLACEINEITTCTPTTDVSLDWNEFYNAQFDRIYRLILRAGVANADAEDLVQRTFLTAHRRLQDGMQMENPSAWIRGTALKVVSDYYRRRKVRRLKSWLLPFLPGVVPEQRPDPEHDASTNQLQRQLSNALAQLSPKLRDAFVLLDVEQISLEEAARVLDVPTNTLRSRRRLALDAIRHHFANIQRGDTP